MRLIKYNVKYIWVKIYHHAVKNWQKIYWENKTIENIYAEIHNYQNRINKKGESSI